MLRHLAQIAAKFYDTCYRYNMAIAMMHETHIAVTGCDGIEYLESSKARDDRDDIAGSRVLSDCYL